jgi:hypothetical protein
MLRIVRSYGFMNSLLRISLLVALLCFAGSSVGLGQGSLRRPKVELLREIDLEEGKLRLNAFRQLWLEGDFSLKYALQYIPRRGKRLEIEGTLWGTNSPNGPISLIQLHTDSETQLYLKNGPSASVSRRDGLSHEWLDVAFQQWFEPIDKLVTITAFDLMMPFVYWPEWKYEGVTKVRGRVAHAFLMIAPDELKANPLGVYGVVVFLDESFNAMLKADYVTEEDIILKSFRLLDLKKIDGVWLPKTVDFLNEETRNKTRLIVREAAMNQDFGDLSFTRGVPAGSVPEIPLSDYKPVR